MEPHRLRRFVDMVSELLNNLIMSQQLQAVSTGGSTGGSTVIVSSTTHTTDPGVNNDLAHGYPVGSTWVNTSTGNTFISTVSTTGAAVWYQFSYTTMYPASVFGKLNSSCTISAGDTWTDDASGATTTLAAGTYMFITTVYGSLTLDAATAAGSSMALQLRYKNSTGPTYTDPQTVGWANDALKGTAVYTTGTSHAILTIATNDTVLTQFNCKLNGATFSAASVISDATDGRTVTSWFKIGS